MFRGMLLLSWDSSASIVTSYRPDNQGLVSGSGRERISSLHHQTQTGFAANPTSYSTGTGISFSRGKVVRV